MKLRSTINGMMPRTLRDAARDPWDWLQASPRPDTPAEQVAGVVLAVVLGIVLAALLVHWLAS